MLYKYLLKLEAGYLWINSRLIILTLALLGLIITLCLAYLGLVQPVRATNVTASVSNWTNAPLNVGLSSGLGALSGQTQITGKDAKTPGFEAGEQFLPLAKPDSAMAIGPSTTGTLIDIAVVFDVSGSMNFETNCFGCWTEDPAKSADIMNNPFPSNGDFNPLTYEPAGGGGPFNPFWDGNIPGSAGHPICGASSQPFEVDGFKYLVHEAEFYSQDFPIQGWRFDLRYPGQGFWVLQRQNRGSNNSYIRTHPFVTYSQNNLSEYPQLQGAAYNAECFDGPNLSGACWETRANSIAESAPSNVPFVEYDFIPNWDGDTHIWIRAIGGSSWSWEWYGQSPVSLNDWRKSIYWQVNNENVQGGPFPNLNDQGNERILVDDNNWRWLKLGSVSTTNGVLSTLRLYQGSAGFNLDKIILTNNPDGSVGMAIDNSGSTVGGGNLSIGADVFSLNSGKGPDATNGSATREACNICNPAFGQTVTVNGGTNPCSCRTGPGDTAVANPLYGGGGSGLNCTAVVTTTNLLENDLFYDIAPLRNAQEWAKNLGNRKYVDPQCHQLGFVAFATDTINDPQSRSKLQCLSWSAIPGNPETSGNVARCYDPALGTPISYTHVVEAIENQQPQGGTDIAEGLREGLEELGVSVPGNTVDSGCSLGTNGQHACDQGDTARRVIILFADGAPNTNPGNCDASSGRPDLWNGLVGNGDPDYECAMYYAWQAANNNIVVYTIGIGPGADEYLLTAMAEGEVLPPDPTLPCGPNNSNGHPCDDDAFYFASRGGRYFPSVTPGFQDFILVQILDEICNFRIYYYLPIILKNTT